MFLPGLKVRLCVCVCVCVFVLTAPSSHEQKNGIVLKRLITWSFCVFSISRILTLVGYEPSELVGKTVYHFHNPLDAQKIQSCHANRK